MALKYPELFKPFKIGNVTIKNRIAVSPMNLGSRYDEKGNFTPEVIDYFEERAKGGVGLIYTGGYSVGCGVEATITSQEPLADTIIFNKTIKELSERLHSYDTKLIVEIGIGAGRVLFPSMMLPEMNGTPVAPSAVPNRWDPSLICRPLTTEEVQNIIKASIDAGVQIHDAGADGISVGGPYGGYFVDQFMTPIFNLRDDEYGYGQNGQTRVVTEVIKGIREKCGPNFIIDVRMSAKHYMKAPATAALPGEEFEEYGRDIDGTIELAKEIEATGANSILIGNGSYDSFYWLYPPVYQKEGVWLDDAKKIKEAVNIPVICPGKINTPEMANNAIRDGYIDCVAIGRASIADPYWASKARAGKDEEIRPCIGCENGCLGRIFSGGLLTCAVNPQVCKEKTDPVLPALKKKKVVVIGGGVGGMEAAIVASERGHDVTLFEAQDHLGGLFSLAAVPEFKHGDHRLLAWFEREVKKSGTDIRLGTKATAEEIIAMNPDAVLNATGAKPRKLRIKGIEESDVITASDVLGGKQIGSSCVIVGGGLVGCEVAVWLANQGKKVTLLEALPELMIAGAPVPDANRLMMLDMLKGAGVDVFTGSFIQSFENGIVSFKNENGIHEVKAASVVQATGFISDNTLYNELAENTDIPVWNIGDSKAPNNVLASVRDAFFIAKNI